MYVNQVIINTTQKRGLVYIEILWKYTLRLNKHITQKRGFCLCRAHVKVHMEIKKNLVSMGAWVESIRCPLHSMPRHRPFIKSVVCLNTTHAQRSVVLCFLSQHAPSSSIVCTFIRMTIHHLVILVDMEGSRWGSTFQFLTQVKQNPYHLYDL